ncbi:MAG: BglG family transcription antiterminator [Erysipelotrichaceae bacterium]|nr:BglG family transcription antiterminator [Erysipelotrichaceae bacterium]MDY5252728.1 BglG family transcription antiterminator [Erysipelotrichaceae bacterium]
MNKRQYKIIEKLNEKGQWITGKELAMILNVSDRTIRNDIEAINKEYPGLIISHVRNGYCVKKEILVKTNIIMKSDIPQTAQERYKYIVIELLFKKNRINLLDLQDEIFVSEFTLKHDLKAISKTIEGYDNLQLIKDGNYISLVGSEGDKRRLYRQMLASETQGDFANINKIDELFPNLNLIRVKDELEKILHEYDYSVRKESYPMLMIHVGVAIERMMNANYIDVKRKVEIQQTLEYHIANAFFSRLASFLRIEINENEVALFAGLLMGRRAREFITSEIYVKQAEELTNLIIEGIISQYDIDFSSDTFFQNGLNIHIQNLLERMANGVDVSNVYLNDIKKNYPLVFEMSVFIGRIIEEKMNIAIQEDEFGYLAIHIGAAYDRLNTKQYYHAILIQPNGRMLSNICYKKINDKFGDRLIIDEVTDYYEDNLVERLSLDLILTTVHLSSNLNIPIVNISMFANSNDEYKISKAINELDSRRNRDLFYRSVRDLVSDECYFYNLECDDYREVINIMCDRLYEQKRVTSEFKASTFEREKIAYTSFNYGFAIPHPLDYATIKSTIGIAILKKPIKWGNYMVKFVLLLAFKSDEKNLLKIFFDWFGDISDNALLMANITEAKTTEQFIDLIKGKDS